MNKKPRADSRLKTLLPDRQEEIAEHASSHKLSETVAWLRADGLVTSIAALSDFLSWYQLQAQFRQDEQTTESLLEQLQQTVPGLSEAELDDLGQRTFSLLSIRRQDLEGFVTVRSARSRAELEKAKLKLREAAETRLGQQAKLAREKFEFDAAKAALEHAGKLQRLSRDNKLTEPEKVNATRQLLFGILPQTVSGLNVPKTIS